MARDRGVHPDCPNATNPFHICAEYCSHGPVPRSVVTDKKEILVLNGVGRRENGAKVEEGRRRSVEPLYVNASNPPLKGDEMMENHQELLTRSNMLANKEILVSNGVGRKENGGKVEGGRRRSVDVNASNLLLKGDEMMEKSEEPLHRSNMLANEEILVSNGVGRKENGRKVEEGRRRIVDVNASNPPLKGDEMMENLEEPLPRSIVPDKKEILVPNGVGSKDTLGVNESNSPLNGDEIMESPQEPLPRSNILVLNGVGSKEKVEGGRRRSVDPMCVNASNPFHQCADYCIRRSQDGKSPLNGSNNFGGRKEKVVSTDKTKVNPNCPNASNPFHQCADYCSARSVGANQHKQGKAGESNSKGGLIVAQRKDVNPVCVNASNPFHKCTEHCSQTRRN